MNSVLQRIYEIGIVPVIAFNSVDEAVPLCKALVAGGLPAAEVTFRTACAEDCIKKIHAEVPEMLLGAGTVLTEDQADRALAAGASFIVAPGFDPNVTKHVIDKGGLMMPGTCSAGEMQQAMNLGCDALKFFPAEANGGVAMLKNIGGALKTAKWMCTGHIGINCADDTEAMKTAELLGSLLNMAVKPGNSSIFVGKKEFEIMKKPGRGTHGHIAIKTNNVDRAIYHLGLRGVKFDMDSKNVKNGKTTAIYMADEIGGFAIHLVQK